MPSDVSAIGVLVGDLFLDEVAAELACALVVADDDAFDRLRAGQRRRGAGALDLADLRRRVAADEGRDRLEGEDEVRGHRVRRVGDVLIGHARSGDGDGAGLAAGEVDGRIEGVGRRAARDGAGMRTAGRAGDRHRAGGNVDRLAERGLDVGGARDVGRARRRRGRRDGRRGVGRRGAVAAEAVEGVVREAIPLNRGVECVAAGRVTGLDRRLAAERVVHRARETRSPLGSRVEAGLADHVDRRPSLVEDDGIVAVEPAGAVRLVGLGQDRRTCRGLGDHVDVTRRDRAGQEDRQAGRRAAVEVHGHRVAAGGEIDRRAGAVVDLERLVVARALDVLGEEQLRRRRIRTADGHERTRCCYRSDQPQTKMRHAIPPLKSVKLSPEPGGGRFGHGRGGL